MKVSEKIWDYKWRLMGVWCVFSCYKRFLGVYDFLQDDLRFIFCLGFINILCVILEAK